MTNSDPLLQTILVASVHPFRRSCVNKKYGWREGKYRVIPINAPTKTLWVINMEQPNIEKREHDILDIG